MKPILSLIVTLIALVLPFRLVADERDIPHVHVGGRLAHTPFSPVNLIWYQDIVFDDSSGNLKDTSLDVYVPDPEIAGAPVVVYVHGGGYVVGDKAWHKDLDPKPEYFTNKLGYIFVSTNYRLLPEGKYPTNTQDVANALAWVHENIAAFGGDPEQIFLMGHSAGAGLASQVGTNEVFLENADKEIGLLKGVILIDGSGYDFSSMAPEQRLERYGHDWLKASPVGNIGPGKNIPPYLFLHVEEGLSSGSTSAKSAVDMAKALTDADIRASVVSLDHVEHFGANERIGEPGDITTVAVERFLGALRGSDRK